MRSNLEWSGWAGRIFERMRKRGVERVEKYGTCQQSGEVERGKKVCG
jgi:hypothetical protein